VQQILAIPCKRHDNKLVDFLTREEIEAILQKPDRNINLAMKEAILKEDDTCGSAPQTIPAG
jgi:integrase/recombinase XerD